MGIDLAVNQAVLFVCFFCDEPEPAAERFICFDYLLIINIEVCSFGFEFWDISSPNIICLAKNIKASGLF